MEKIKEQIEQDELQSSLTIQDFMNDMRLLDEQLKDKDLVKPPMNVGDGGITNYLLWLCLGELIKLNNQLEEE